MVQARYYLTLTVSRNQTKYGFNFLGRTSVNGQTPEIFYSGMGNENDIHMPNEKLAPIDKFAVYAITRTNNNVSFFVNGIKADNTKTVNSDYYAGYYLINYESFNGSIFDTPTDIDYAFIAFGLTEHTDDEIIANSKWLMKKYGIEI